MKQVLLIIVSLTISFISFGQITGFKIEKKTTTITEKSKSLIKIGKKQKEKTVYKTEEITNFNRKGKQKDEKQVLADTLRNQLYRNSRGEDGNSLIDEVTYKKKEKEISDLEAEIIVLQKDQDSLYYEYTKDYMSFKRSMILNFGPLRSRAFFDVVYGNTGKTFKALGNGGISIGDNSGALYSEIVSGNLGLFRVSFGTMIANSKHADSIEEKEQEAYQRLVNYGGNTVLNFEYPFAYLHSKTNQYNLISRFVAKGTADFPAFGTNTDKFAGSATIGIDFYGDASVRDKDNKKNVLTFFFNFNANRIYGTDVFKTNLGVDNSNFTFGQLSLGLIFLENFKLSFIVSTFSSEEKLRNKNVVMGGQVLR